MPRKEDIPYKKHRLSQHGTPEGLAVSYRRAGGFDHVRHGSNSSFEMKSVRSKRVVTTVTIMQAYLYRVGKARRRYGTVSGNGCAGKKPGTLSAGCMADAEDSRCAFGTST